MYYVRRSFALVVLFLFSHIGFANACPPGGGDPNPNHSVSVPSSVAYGSGTWNSSLYITNNTCSGYTLQYLLVTIAAGSGSGATLVVPSISGAVATTLNASDATDNVLEANAQVSSYKLWFTSGVYIASEANYPLSLPGDAGTTTGTAVVAVRAGYSGHISENVESNSMSITSP